MKQQLMSIKNNYSKKGTVVVLSVQSYVANDQIAILLYTKDWEYYGDLSVFVEAFDDRNLMAVDVNNLPYADEFIQRYRLWNFAWYVHSWFVYYPVYKMNLIELEKRDREWVKKFA